MFDEGHALLRRNSAASYLPSSKDNVTSTPIVTASRVDDQGPSMFFSSSSIAKMLNNFDNNSSSAYQCRRQQGHRSSCRSATRSTSSTSMRKYQQRRSSSGSGLSSTSSTNSATKIRLQNGAGPTTSFDSNFGRASSSSSLNSYDDRYDHLYSYSSNLDLFAHQLYKQAARKASAQQHRGPSDKSEAVNDFDLTAETRLLMDRTNQLVGKKSDREWVI